MKPLRGQRYADRFDDDDLKAFVTDTLPYLSYESAVEFYAGFAASEPGDAEIAFLGCNDRFYLLTVLLRRPDALDPWLYDRCREVELDPNDVLDLWARYHYKSTIVTFAGTIQEILCDPEMTVGIFSMTKDIAAGFLDQIKRELESNEFLKHVYNDVLWADPANQAPRWSAANGIIIRRRSNPKEATVEAHGLMEALPVGRHFRMLMYDDIINERVVTQTDTDQIEKATTKWELSTYLGVGEATIRRYVGTRYLFGDTYQQMQETGAVRVRIYPATEDGTLKGKPVFLTESAWKKVLQTNRRTVAAQMLQNPLAGTENTFRVEWLRPFYVRPRLLTVYIMGDPSMGLNPTSDRTAIVVVGMDALSNFYMLDGYCHRMTLSERWRRLKELHQRWEKAPGVQFVRVGWERYGLQADIEHFKVEMLREGTFFEVKELAWVRQNDQSKEARVGRLEPAFRNSKFYLPGTVWHPDHGESLWDVEELEIGESEDATSSQLVFWSKAGALTEEREATQRSERHRVQQMIRRIDEDGSIYDLTRTFFEEFSFFPFSAKKDLVDATSRIYDMEPVPPLAFDASALAPKPTRD